MLVYRVERRFCTQRADIKSVEPTDIGSNVTLFPSWNKEPRSPYGWVGTDNSGATYEFLDKNNIGCGNFNHVRGNVGIPHRPAAGSDIKLTKSILEFFGVDSLAYAPSKWHQEYYFGFETEGHFYKWFDEDDFDDLRYKGYYLALYEVCDNNVLKGDTQLMFKRAEAVQVGFILF